VAEQLGVKSVDAEKVKNPEYLMNMLKKYGKGGENIVEINKSNKKRTKSESGIVDSKPAL
jgi:hypothetical protein